MARRFKRDAPIELPCLEFDEMVLASYTQVDEIQEALKV
jgi:hypothetical protein